VRKSASTPSATGGNPNPNLRTPVPTQIAGKIPDRKQPAVFDSRPVPAGPKPAAGGKGVVMSGKPGKNVPKANINAGPAGPTRKGK